MKVLFVYKGLSFAVPIGTSVISAALKEAGHETHLSMMRDAVADIEAIQPDVVAYSSSTGEAKHYLKFNEQVKQRFPDVFTIMGGSHATFFPEQIHDSTLDAMCVGEGEGAIVDLLSGNNINVPNIYSGNGLVDIRPLIQDLDSLPFPDYDLFYENVPQMGQSYLKSFIASRGCPYPCTYCFNHAWKKLYSGKGKLVRRHSVDYMIEDIERVRAKWPLSTVKFYDDIFTYRADDWLEEFARKYRERIGLPFFILTRADLITEDMVKLLKEAGIFSIAMSIEAGNQEIRYDTLKRPMADKQIMDSLLLCREYGINTLSNCIIGFPVDNSLEKDLESVDMCLKCKVDWAEFPQFFPFPKTELGDWTIEQGYYKPDYNTMHTSYQFESPLNCFTEKEKKMQRNLALLGSVVMVFPWLRPLLEPLIKLPPNRIFLWVHFTVKMWVTRKKIYKTDANFWESMKIFWRSFKQDAFRHKEE